MKKFVILISMILLFFPMKTNAQRGCCSHHGGVAGCNSDGRQICNDGTLNPSCTCTPIVQHVYGCTDLNAKNYNEDATKDDGSCEYYIEDTIKDNDIDLYPVVNNNSNNSESTEEESSSGAGAIFCLICGGALATYLYKRNKKKSS